MLPRRTERIIKEVNLRPILWNTTHREYLDKSAKDEAWLEVCSAVVDDFGSKSHSEKELILKSIRAKWRNVRDSYNRELRQNPKREPKYIYSDQLGFIKDFFKRRTKPCSAPSRRRTFKNAAKRVRNPAQLNSSAADFEMDLPEIPSLSLANGPYEADEDVAFFMSLMSSVKALGPDQKLYFRMEILRILNDIRKNSEFCDEVFAKPSSSAAYSASGPRDFASSSGKQSVAIKMEESDVSDESD